jgi:hypothetical protein
MARRFPFAFEPTFRVVERAFGVTPASTWVDVGDDRFEARFGPWRVRTALDNVADASVTGPYSIPKTIGPARLSFKDRGLTFATNTHRGVCISFRKPVVGLDPFGLLRHPGLTVTVADPAGLVDALSRSLDVVEGC